MKKYLFFIIMFFTFSCQDKFEVVETFDDSGKLSEKYFVQKDTKKKEGKFIRFSSTGDTLEIAFYKDDLLDGIRKIFNENGNIQVIENHSKGNFEGTFKAFYDKGGVELEGKYILNKMTGKWKKYYESGKLMEIVTFKDNEENGPFVEYYENGNLKAEGNYLGGDNEHGLLKLYDEQGKLKRKMECNHGICKTIWKSDSISTVVK